MRDLFEITIRKSVNGEPLDVESIIASLGLRGRIFDVVGAHTGSSRISDDTKSMIYVRQALDASLKCPLCHGKLDPAKSVSYDHIVRVRDGGHGGESNVQMTHPYCNSARDVLEKAQ